MNRMLRGWGKIAMCWRGGEDVSPAKQTILSLVSALATYALLFVK